MGDRSRVGVGAALALLAFTVVSVATDSTSGDARAQPLFRIERSKNANVVQYDARLLSDGRLDPREPVVGYWLRLAKDGRRKELSWIQRRFAYGFKTRFDAARDVAVLEMAADIQREVRVYRDGDVYRAETLIDGHPAFLEKLFVHSTEGRWMPKVKYIDFFGADVESGAERYERFVPN
jgi:hypothetical protein